MLNTYTREYEITESTNTTNSTQPNVMTVKIYYRRNPSSFATYRQLPRGYYFSVTPENVSRKNGYTMKSFTAFSGISGCVLECNRQSKKKYEEAKAMFDDCCKKYLEPFCKENGYVLSDDYRECERESSYID